MDLGPKNVFDVAILRHAPFERKHVKPELEVHQSMFVKLQVSIVTLIQQLDLVGGMQALSVEQGNMLMTVQGDALSRDSTRLLYHNQAKSLGIFWIVKPHYCSLTGQNHEKASKMHICQ